MIKGAEFAVLQVPMFDSLPLYPFAWLDDGIGVAQDFRKPLLCRSGAVRSRRVTASRSCLRIGLKTARRDRTHPAGIRRGY